MSVQYGIFEYKTAIIDCGTLGDNTIVSAITTKRIKVYAITLVVSAAVNCMWKSGTTAISGAMNFSANGGYSHVMQPPAIILQTNTGEALVLNLSGATPVDGHIAYWEE